MQNARLDLAVERQKRIPQPFLLLNHLCEAPLALSILPLRSIAVRFLSCLCRPS